MSLFRRLFNIAGQPVNPATSDAQIDGTQKTKVVDSAGDPCGFVDTESGRALIVYQAARGDSGYIHFHAENLGTGTYNFVLIDISDTDNYNHTATNYAHEELREISIKCDINGEWKASLGFVEDVAPAGSTFYVVNHWQGAKDTGNTLQDGINMFPAGPHLVSSKITTHQASQTTDYRSDLLIPSTLSGVNVYPGDGDVVLTIEVTAGNILEFKINIGYHSH